MKLIMFGPPGAGKGTFSSRLAHILGICRISTGDIFREHIAQGTKLGGNVKVYVQKGILVPDKIVIPVLKRRLSQSDCEKGFILDGYPRTVPQAKALENEKIDVIINLIVPDEILIAKCVARRICQDCGDIYNILKIDKTIKGITYSLPSMPSNVKGRCDKCGGDLIQRIDDTPQVIKTRLDIYWEQSTPIIQYYQDKIQFIDQYVRVGPEIMISKMLDKLKSKNLL
jgi:adenylate kinase